MIDISAPLRLRLDGDALVSNWRALDRMSGTAACGAAIKADGYGLGAEQVAVRLANAGCRDFFVSNWREAAALAHLGLPLSVLHGVREEDMPIALSGIARPVLNTPAQVARWKESGGGVCDVMVDTGMNRLGLAGDDLDLLDELQIETLMSHLACADEDVDMNAQQCRAFAHLSDCKVVQRRSLANSAGIALGRDFTFDLTRPGIALYGCPPRSELVDVLRQVVFLEAQVLQCRLVRPGATVGYNATWMASAQSVVAIVNAGYADGYPRSLSGEGTATFGGARLPVIGRVSMDLVALLVPSGVHLAEDDWVSLAYDLPREAARAGRSGYELLTGLGHRFDRHWS